MSVPPYDRVDRIEIDCLGATDEQLDALFDAVASLAHEAPFDVSVTLGPAT